MITIPVAVLAVAVGVLLAAVEGPYPYDKARTSRFSLLLVTIGAATVAAGGALVVRDWLLG